jgi:hypothetical protein
MRMVQSALSQRLSETNREFVEMIGPASLVPATALASAAAGAGAAIIWQWESAATRAH